MGLDIDHILKNWEYEPGEVVARQVRARDGRAILQMRLDLGVLQMEVEGRPDGTQPHGFESYFDYLRHLAERRSEKPFCLTEEQCEEADREFLQFYHRRLCWLALKEYERAIADADHNLAFMDLIKAHSPNEQYTLSHEQYRCYVLYHRAQAAVALALDHRQPEEAIDAVQDAIHTMQTFFDEHDLADQFDDDLLVRRMRELERRIRRRYHVRATLREQLNRAISNEQYELAARLRDRLRARQANR